MSMTTLTDANFKDEIDDGLVLVQLWASRFHRGPACKLVEEIVNELRRKYRNIKFCIMNADTELKTVERLRIMSVPTLLFYKDGIQVDKSTGTKGDLKAIDEDWTRRLINGKVKRFAE